MKSLGIRQTKAHLSQLVRDAANGQCSIVTDNRKPVAMIGPPPAAIAATDVPAQPSEPKQPLSDAAAFRRALLDVPFPLDLEF